MRGRREPQVTMLAFIDLESRVPPDHPLRTIKVLADRALERLSPEFDRMYAEEGRPSIPPERLLKASLLIALYSVRSERAFCEELDYHLLFRWFLDMNLIEPSFDATTFTKNRERLLRHQVGQQLFDEVVWEADVGGSVVCLEQAHGRLYAGTEGGWIHGFDPDGRRRSTQTVHRPIRGISPVSPDRIIAVLDDGSVCTNGQLTSSGIGPIIDSTQSTAHWPDHGLLVGADDADRVALYH